ncbi:NAD(P)/FAD-dependent oxidoreductase [Desulfospira joergensenii]|uniref:NAD(P)/FAD-dependent oxidoreductase n=1 Tax=Desulfospira joergensenii TaxID=53329 RepID=UPI0003B4D1FA|nr:NAD(P)/FAD-dependent oxidoreductase [Desulfospira joergensenii]
MTIQSDSFHVVIVGSGCAGLAAAEVLTREKMDVLMIDENPVPGGQLLRGRGPARDAASRLDSSKKKGFSLIRGLEGSGIHLLSPARVWGIFDRGRTLLISETSKDGKERIREIRAGSIILATGARERFLPFKGWTLPGVMSCGAAQILIKTHGVLPAQSTLIAGTSPLQMVLASQILLNQGRVKGLVNLSSFGRQLNIFRNLPHSTPKILEGLVHQARIWLSRTPVHFQTGILEARGKRALESVVTSKLDHKGRPVPGTEKIHETRALALGHGFAPNVELAAQAGCSLSLDRSKGGWAVAIDDCLETSVPGIYGAGETVGIAGGKKSLIEGRLAALSILGRTDPELLAQRKREQDYGVFLNRLCRIPKEAWGLVHDDTIICRCEEITMGRIRRALGDGFETAGILKKATRAGMGLCQGRTCGPMILDILAALTGNEGNEIHPPSSRAPVTPLPIQTLLRRN